MTKWLYCTFLYPKWNLCIEYSLTQHLVTKFPPFFFKKQTKKWNSFNLHVKNSNVCDWNGRLKFTSGIRWSALSRLRFRWCWVKLIRVFVTCETGGNKIPIDLNEAHGKCKKREFRKKNQYLVIEYMICSYDSYALSVQPPTIFGSLGVVFRLTRRLYKWIWRLCQIGLFCVAKMSQWKCRKYSNSRSFRPLISFAAGKKTIELRRNNAIADKMYWIIYIFFI